MYKFVSMSVIRGVINGSRRGCNRHYMSSSSTTAAIVVKPWEALEMRSQQGGDTVFLYGMTHWRRTMSSTVSSEEAPAPEADGEKDKAVASGNERDHADLLKKKKQNKYTEMENNYSNNVVVADTCFKIKKSEPELVRPATETFNGLYFLSDLDQTYTYTIEILASCKPPHATRDDDEKLEDGFSKTVDTIRIIKESLEKVLVHYYPFAGCLATTSDGKMVVQCTGKGVPFVEAVVEDHEIDVLGDISVLDPVKLRRFVHFVEDEEHSIIDVPLLSLQVTKFKCGGIVLGIRMNHVLIDGTALVEFMNAWSELARSGNLPLSFHPFLNRSIYRSRTPLEVDLPHSEYMKLEKLSIPNTKNNNDNNLKSNSIHPSQEPLKYRSFCLDPEKISQLKELATSTLDTTNCPLRTPPTSFELISAIMWIGRTKAFKIKNDETTQILIVVDGRSKFKSGIPERYFGNGCVLSCAKCTAGELSQKPLLFAVKLVQNAIKKVTEDYVRSALDYRAQLDENSFAITKWSRMNFYETDFGWGKPMQVVPASIIDNLVVTLSQGRESKNIVVSLSLPISTMKIFEDVMLGEFQLN